MINSQKTIFISVYDGDIEKCYLRSGVLDLLKEQSNLKIILLIRTDKNSERHQYYIDNFSADNVIVEALPKGMNRFEYYLQHLAWNTLPTRSAYVKRHDLYLKHKNHFRYALESTAGFLGKWRWWRNFLRFAYLLIPDNFGEELFIKYQPDLLFAPNMFSPDDSRLLRYAKKHQIKTVTTAKSWDVPTTRGFTRVKADRILVFNEINKKEIVAIGDYNINKVFCIGFPQFDIYYKKNIYLPREEFLNKIGADPSKRLVLFAVPGDFKNPFSHEIIQMLDEAIENKMFIKDIQILARFHPKYTSTAEHLKNLKNIILDRPGTYFSKDMEDGLDAPLSKTFQWTFTNNDLIHLANSLYHSDVTINTESTMTLDAITVGRPVVLVGFDGRKNLPYWHSIIRNYSREHLQAILETKGVRLAETFDQMVEGINLYLKTPEAEATERTTLKQKVLYRDDGRATNRVVDNIYEVLNSGT